MPLAFLTEATGPLANQSGNAASQTKAATPLEEPRDRFWPFRWRRPKMGRWQNVLNPTIKVKKNNSFWGPRNNHLCAAVPAHHQLVKDQLGLPNAQNLVLAYLYVDPLHVELMVELVELIS